MAGDLDDILRAYDPEERPITTQDIVAHTPQPSWFERNAGPAIDMWRNAEAGLANATQQFNERAAGDLGRLLGRHIEPEEMAGVNALIGGVKAPGQPVRIDKPIKPVFHGSPYDFKPEPGHPLGRFDLEKVGTGEGAQAYGHGLYFAEHEPVAQSYRHTQITPEDEAALDNVAIYRDKANFNDRRAAEMARVDAARGHWDKDALMRAAEMLESGYPQPGRMYEVALHATPEQFLDWDKPYGAQSKAAQDALQRHAPGAQFDPDVSIPIIQRIIENETGSPNEMALTLGREGIPGIRYLDQLSRNDTWTVRGPKGSVNDFPDEASARKFANDNPGYVLEQKPVKTSNYVVWSPEIIEILRKYGLIPPVAAAALYGHGGDEQ